MIEKKLRINRRGEICQMDTGLFTRVKPGDWGTFQSAFQGTILSGDRIGTRFTSFVGDWREVRDDGSNPWPSQGNFK